jgi:hypothetical protein
MKIGVQIPDFTWPGFATVLGGVRHVERITPLGMLGREVIPAVTEL